MMTILKITQLENLTYATFDARTESEKKTINWAYIASMTAYKVDLITYDELNLDVQLTDGTILNLNEETAGWVDFCQLTKKVFPAISPTWDVDLMFPAFEANRAVIYNKE